LLAVKSGSTLELQARNTRERFQIARAVPRQERAAVTNHRTTIPDLPRAQVTGKYMYTRMISRRTALVACALVVGDAGRPLVAASATDEGTLLLPVAGVDFGHHSGHASSATAAAVAGASLGGAQTAPPGLTVRRDTWACSDDEVYFTVSATSAHLIDCDGEREAKPCSGLASKGRHRVVTAGA